jgi:hypothetical protein
MDTELPGKSRNGRKKKESIPNLPAFLTDVLKVDGYS